jgi:hypothetical protein
MKIKLLLLITILLENYLQGINKTEINLASGNIFSSLTADNPNSGLRSVIFGKNISTKSSTAKAISTMEHLSFIPITNAIKRNTFSGKINNKLNSKTKKIITQRHD